MRVVARLSELSLKKAESQPVWKHLPALCLRSARFQALPCMAWRRWPSYRVPMRVPMNWLLSRV